MARPPAAHLPQFMPQGRVSRRPVHDMNIDALRLDGKVLVDIRYPGGVVDRSGKIPLSILGQAGLSSCLEKYRGSPSLDTNEHSS